MLHLPKFTRISHSNEIDAFACAYFQCSGFNVNRNYFETNQVFAIYLQERMIGGFVLGAGATLRTIEVFSGDAHRPALYQQVRKTATPTELCCFWIDPTIRTKTRLNFFVWLCVAYALWFYGTPMLIFGTNSVRLAALYSATPKCRLIHGDFVNNKQTFIFTGPRKDCLVGVAQILYYKMKRLAKIAGKRGKRMTASVSGKRNAMMSKMQTCH